MIGDRLKKLRMEKGLSQKELAAHLDTSQGYISDIEKGAKKPGVDFLISLKRFFKVDLDWFLTGEAVVAEEQPAYGRKTVAKDKILQLLDALDEDKQQEVLKYAEEKKLLAEMMAERNKRKK